LDSGVRKYVIIFATITSFAQIFTFSFEVFDLVVQTIMNIFINA